MTKKKKTTKSDVIQTPTENILKLATMSNETSSIHGERNHQPKEHATKNKQNSDSNANYTIEKLIDLASSNIDTAFACTTMINSAAENIKEQFTNYTNHLFALNQDIMKEFFQCSNYAEILEFKEKLITSNLKASNQNIEKINHIVFSTLDKAQEPIHKIIHNSIDCMTNIITPDHSVS